MSNQPLDEKRRLRSIYLLPNLFTIAALFAGFYAIVASMREKFVAAAVAIFIAMLMDALDGRVARLTNTQTFFGAELDSLSDMVSFGVAPALVIYNWSLHTLGKVGWLASFIFAVAVALRLARFNTQLGKSSKRYFKGLPCPSGAGVLAGLVWFGTDFNFSPNSLSVLILILTILIALCMISNFRYRSFKDLDLKGSVPFVAILIAVLILVLIAIAPPQVLFIVFFLYAGSGPLAWLWFVKKMRSRKQAINRKLASRRAARMQVKK